MNKVSLTLVSPETTDHTTEKNEYTYTIMSITQKLHCYEMISATPLIQSYTTTKNVHLRARSVYPSKYIDTVPCACASAQLLICTPLSDQNTKDISQIGRGCTNFSDDFPPPGSQPNRDLALCLPSVNNNAELFGIYMPTYTLSRQTPLKISSQQAQLVQNTGVTSERCSVQN